MTETATLTSKSQLTLPKAVRETLGVGPGDQVHFVPSLRGYRIVAMTGDVRRLKGMFKGRAAPASVEEMNRAVADAVLARDARSRAR
jgi:AbrB family looped-hinge helix DNA binding protein